MIQLNGLALGGDIGWCAPGGNFVMPETFCQALEMESSGDYLGSGIKSRADALANLPSRARWLPRKRRCGRSGNQTGDATRQPSSVRTDGGFLHVSEHHSSATR